MDGVQGRFRTPGVIPTPVNLSALAHLDPKHHREAERIHRDVLRGGRFGDRAVGELAWCDCGICVVPLAEKIRSDFRCKHDRTIYGLPQIYGRFR